MKLFGTFVRYCTTFICMGVFFLSNGCKDPIIEDTDLLTADDELNLAKDSLNVKVFSFYEEKTAGNTSSTAVLGSMNDPAFGKTYGSFYTQLRLGSNNVTFGTNPVIDSAVLSFAYGSSYGSFKNGMTINVFEINQSILDSTTYYTSDAFSVNIPRIGQLIFDQPNVTDSVRTAFGNFAPHLRIPLTKTFAQHLLDTDTNILETPASFLSYFKGVYVTTNTNYITDAVLYLNLNSPLSRITLYYHNDTEDSLSFDIQVSGNKVNHVDHEYAGSPAAESINNPNPAGEEKIFLQGGIGTRGKILIQNLDSLPKNIAINKAELIFTQSSADTTFAAPLVLDLFRIDDAGAIAQLEDDGLSHFGGVRVAETVDGITLNRYRFNIRKYFQRLVDGTYNNNGLYLQILSPHTNLERLVIANPSADEKQKVQLAITYTIL